MTARAFLPPKVGAGSDLRGQEQRVAVVGLGAVFPGAPDVDSFWHNIVNSVDAVTAMPGERCDPELFDFGCDRGGFVDGDGLLFDPSRFGVMPAAVGDGDPDQFLALATAAAALDDVGGRDGIAPERIGVILGRGGYLTSGGARFVQRVRTAHQLLVCLRAVLPDVGEARREAVKDAFLAELGPLRPEATVGVMPNLAASRIANRLDLGGPAYVIDAACASSLLAVDSALAELASGRCDLVLAGGVHHCDDLVLWAGFSKLGALSPSGAIRPFSRQADGILIGEGTGILALERLADAVRRGHRVYAVIRGTGVAGDGRAGSMVSPAVDGQVRALERAYQSGGVDPETVGLVEGHGTATPTGDKAELETLRRIYGKTEGDRAVLGSVKSMIGHAMPAAGAAGLIKAVLAVHHGVLPPTLHADEPHPALADTRFRLLDRAEPWDSNGSTPRRAGVNAFGFGGINAHVIVEQPPKFGGSAPVLGVKPPNFELVEDGRGRLAIVDPTPAKRELAERVVAKGKPWRGLKDVWFEPEGLVRTGGRVAFLFPGVEPTFDADLEPVARQFDRPLRPVPDGSSPLEAQGHQILAAGRLLHDVLGDLGVRPDDIAGHSMGEWTGWYAGELIPRDQADAYLAELRPGFLEVPGVVYLALGCGVDVAAELIDGLADVAISHDNCTHQSVVCGPTTAIARVQDRLGEHQVMGQVMPFQSGFHSPAFAPYVERLRPLWERMPLRPPTIPLWSATTCERYPDDPDAVRALASDHLVRPVRFRELTERLYADGVRVFVQAGVGSLAAFVDDTLAKRPHLAVAAHVAQRPGLDQLRRTAAALWVQGVDVDLDQLASRPRRSHPARIIGGENAVRLVLGTPLVQLPDSVRIEAGPRRLPAAALPGPLAEAHGALLDEAVQAGDAIAAVLAPEDPSRLGSSGARTQGLRVDMTTFPWLVDHCIIEQRPGWSDQSDGFPVVPLTGIIELLADAARRVAPGQVVSRIDDIRANRFVTAAPPTDAVVRTEPVGPGRVRVTIDGYAQAVVHLAATSPEPPASSARPLTNPRPSPRDAAALYRERWMFHGPRFHGVRVVGDVGDEGIDGEVEVMATPGATLDSAAQLYGWWVLVTNPVDFFVLPRSIERVELYGPQPLPVGRRLATTVRVTELDDRLVRADLELAADGRVVVRIVGSAVRRFNSDGHSWALTRDPGDRLLSSVDPAGFVAVDERWRDPASRELMAHRYLTADERVAYRQRKPLSQRHWLLGRIAAKDAVRQALWARGHGPVFPAEIRLANDEHGRPFVAEAPGDGRELDLSISHTSWVGVALAGPRDPEARLGIDIEAITSRSPQVADTVLSPAEQALRPDGHLDEWLTRAWAAKEAVAKAAGTGLGGRLREFPIRAVDDDLRLLVGDRWVRTVVRTAPVQAVRGASTDTFATDPAPPDVSPDATKEFVVAWTD